MVVLSQVERVLRQILISQARTEQTITYGQIAELVAPVAPVRLEKPFSPLHNWLGNVSRFEHHHRRPLLSAVVVAVESGRPGRGFGTFAATLGREVGNDVEAFWQQEIDDVFAFWSRTRPEQLLQTHLVPLIDGREVRVREYASGALRVLVDDAPYAVTEAFLGGGKTDRAIIRLEPRVKYPQLDGDEADGGSKEAAG